MPFRFHQRAAAAVFFSACLVWMAGAADETRTASAAASEFWAFRPPSQPGFPPVNDREWIRTPVDRFILAKLERQGLHPAPAAPREELIRRLHFDLTGLPPSEAEIAAFAHDPRPDAWERRVEQLLANPRFGERTAQFWLDVVRYAESEGFEYDRHLPDAWRYRDYVIRSFNSDKPYDRFLTEQLAGDEINPSDIECQTAAVFHRLGPVRRNAGNPDIATSRNEVLTERTDILGSAFLGLTVGCARCHDHKLDPISQRDYYRLQAYVAATQENDLVLLPPAENAAWAKRSEAIQEQLKQLRKQADQAEGEARKKLREQIESLEKRLPEQPPTVPGIKDDPTRRTSIHVLKRGEWERKGEKVGPRPPGILVKDDFKEMPADMTNPRLELAGWLTRPDHPLTSRVAVNRLWHRHFGSGIVRTANDFGSHGERPSHPELLDWLACELVRENWSLKPLHRMILLSNSYRQSAENPDNTSARRLDPDNRLLWKFNRRRLSAEEIRDSMLATAGVLNPKMGGPGIMTPVDEELVQLLYKPSQWVVTQDRSEHSRRSIYLIAKRNLKLPFMEAFDQPARLTSCARRESSTHAPQALEMLNGKLANELAGKFAERIRAEAGADSSRQIDHAFRIALGRPATTEEVRLGREFLRDQPLSELALAIFNLNSFLYAP